jgi:predicted SAM-dependent methyltransferase
LKLHLGCGSKYIPGFIHVDVIEGDHIRHQGSVCELPYPDESVDLIYTSHVLEHFRRSEIRNVLHEWYRVLAPGGILRLAVPNFAACAKIYYEEGLKDGLTGLIGLICGGQRNEYDFHKMIFDEPFLTGELLATGFREVRRWDWRLTEHTDIDDYSQAYIPHLEKECGTLMSLNLESVK